MPKINLSAKMRLTAWFTLMILLLSAMVLVFVFVINGASVTDDPAGRLVQVVQRNAKRVEFDNGRFDWEDIRFYRRGVYCAVYDENGDWLHGAVQDSARFDLPLEDGILRTVPMNGTEYYVYDRYVDMSVTGIWLRGSIDSAENNQMTLINKYINAAVEGSGFGPITLECVGNINDRYGAVPAGEFAIGYGAWGGAAFYPFRNMQVYCDPDQYSINEAADWDPKTETLTIEIDGEPVTMTWQAWSGALVGSGPYAGADFETKLNVLSKMEQDYLAKYYRIPLAGSTTCQLLAFKCSYYTEDYNIMYDFGGLRLLQFHYNDAEWAEFVASQNGELNYE